jgi:hypothetical protein
MQNKRHVIPIAQYRFDIKQMQEVIFIINYFTQFFLDFFFNHGYKVPHYLMMEMKLSFNNY